MKIHKIETYEFNELEEEAKCKVLYWLDKDNFVDHKGNIEDIYLADMEECEVEEHCECNGYIFNKYGEPIHHLIITN